MTRKMKDSGIEWIGEIPEDWEVVKIRHIALAESSGLSVDNLLDDGNYEVYDANKLVGYLDNNPVKTNYISIIKDGAGIGRTRLMQKNTNVIGTMNYIIAKNIDLNYLYYTLQVFDFEKYATGSTIPHIYFKDYANEYIALPNNKAQKDIVKHLDFEVDKIIKLVDKVNEQIENLENYKKSVITEAVTKGLDKNVEMKDSGIEWIGEIPKHWKVVPLKHLAIYNQGTLDESTKKDYEFEYIDISSVKYGKGILPLETMTFEKAPSRARRIVHDGDIIISTVRTYLKAIATVPSSDKQMIASTGFCVVRTNGIIEQGFLKYSVQSEHFISEIASKSTGVSYPAINSTDLVNIKVLVPTKSERLEIIKYLDKKTKLIDESIALKQKQLETLEEYKKSLIYEYVTGKKEVKDGEET